MKNIKTSLLIASSLLDSCSGGKISSNMKNEDKQNGYSPLLQKALEIKGKVDFSAEETSNIISECVCYVDSAVSKVKTAKLTIAVLGNTGSGKSTIINTLCGCNMVRSKQNGGKTVISVQQKSEGGFMDPVADIGHSNVSQTFIPEIIQGPQGICFIDCPGFMDNRGTAINIANIINTKKGL